MGLLDGILKEGGAMGALGNIASLAAKNPQAVAALISLLSSKDTSVGDSSGLAGLVNAFQKKGMGDMINSWIATGPNPSISAAQVTDVLGHDVVKQFAAKAGVPHQDAGGLLASLLPAVVDHLTPDGTVPATNNLESSLGGLLSAFMK
jgi:uncharacterized protein YidB (DUF937 family)